MNPPTRRTPEEQHAYVTAKLVAAVAEVHILRKALAFYAEEDNHLRKGWESAIEEDWGQMARLALEKRTT